MSRHLQSLRGISRPLVSGKRTHHYIHKINFSSRFYAKDVFLDDSSWDNLLQGDKQHADDKELYIEEAELQTFMENYLKEHRDTPTQIKERKLNEMRRSALQTKIYNLEKTGSKSERISRWLAECVRLSRENREYSQAILYADRIIEKFVKEFGESSLQVGNARMEKAKLLAITQDWSGCLGEISQVLQCHRLEPLSSIISLDRLTSLYIAEIVTREMPSSFRIPWAPTFTWRDDESKNVHFQQEDGIMYLPPVDQWCNFILDHLKFTVKEIGFQQYKPQILRSVAWMISRQASDFQTKGDKVFEQLEPISYIDFVNREEFLSEKAIKDIQLSIKHYRSVSQYYQKKKAPTSLLGDIEYDIALASYRIKNMDDVIQSCQKAITYYNESGSGSLDIARCCHLLALALRSVDLSQAVSLLDSSLEIMENVDATYNIEYIQFVYSYLTISKHFTKKHKERLERCKEHLSELSSSDILDYFLRLPIAATEWQCIGADKDLMKKSIDELELLCTTRKFKE